ncbi:MAG: nucleotide exchange factor GrpE, partial [Actinobacteria bacterium]|nr:nucleotide exchange factor GrpE [Actinomycetota bacterium]
MTGAPKQTLPEADAIESEEPEQPSDTVSQGDSDLKSRLAAAEADRDEYLDLLQRAKADFENYRKRAARDQEH